MPPGFALCLWLLSLPFATRSCPLTLLLVQVVHNDIKSKNILLTKDAAVAKIADVGTSRILQSTACNLSNVPMLCTWPYAAPEQILGSRHACSTKVGTAHEWSLFPTGASVTFATMCTDVRDSSQCRFCMPESLCQQRLCIRSVIGKHCSKYIHQAV